MYPQVIELCALLSQLCCLLNLHLQWPNNYRLPSQNLKPEPRYGYDPAAPPESRHTVSDLFEVIRFVTDLHESPSMIARSKSRTIAHEPSA